MSKQDSEIHSLIKFNPVHPKDMTKELWLEDFLSFYNLMNDNYPYLWVKERSLGYNWLNLKDNYLMKLEKAKDEMEILSIFWDAVTALQDAHTSIWLPHWMNYHFRENSYFQQRETFRTIFSSTLKEANEYWKPIMEKYYNERNGLDFEVLILYSKGEYIIVDGHGSWEEKYGLSTKITAVNNIPIDKAIRETYEKGFLYYDTKEKKVYQLAIDPKIFGATAKFTIETKKGEVKEVTFSASSEYQYNQIFNYPSESLTTKIWSGKKIAYLRFQNFELDNFNEGIQEFLLAFYTKIKDYNHLIIDIRGNSGGWKDVWINNIIVHLTKKKLISNMFIGYRKGDYVNLFRKESGIEKIVAKEKFTHLPPETLLDDYSIYDVSINVEPSGKIDFNAKISILIDNFTWSAASAFALFCKETKLAKLYGTPSKGEAISSGTIFYVLPNSKIAIRFNPGLGIDFNGNSCEEAKIQPNVHYESEIGNQNELLEFVFKELEKEI